MSLNIINFWKQEIKNNNNVQSVSITLTVLTSPLIMTPLQGKLDPVSRVTGIPGWYWILGIKCSDTTGVGLVY